MSSWVPIGPGPIINGQAEGIKNVDGDNPVSGSIADIAPLVGNPDVIYVAATNGGVWRTTNATAPKPHWVPLTDFALPGLSLGSVAISPVREKTIFAGAARVSSCGHDGGQRFGIARSDDEGETWKIVGAELADQDICNILPMEEAGGDVILAGASNGLYRSVDNGRSFSPVSSGVPLGKEVTGLARDPGVRERVYAAIDGVVYVSNNFGAAWNNASGVGFQIVPGARILLSVHNKGPGIDVVYAMVTSHGRLVNVYQSRNQGGRWVSLGVPPEIFPGGAASLHGAIVADPNAEGVVYVSGDRQEAVAEGESENRNGATDYSGNVFRFVDGSKSRWENLVMRGANGTSPHADSRRLVFDASGDLLYACDGGIFKLTTTSRRRDWKWVSLNGDLSVTEAHSAAFDPVTEIAFSGNQDTGTSVQPANESIKWKEVIAGDGAKVAVDCDQRAHHGNSIRYWSYPYLDSFNRAIYDDANNIVGHAVLGLEIISGPGTGNALREFDGNIQFYCPYALNRLEPKRMLIGTRYIYESSDYGDSLSNLGFVGSVGDGLGNNPISYGGYDRNGTENPGAFFLGAGSDLFYRTADGCSVLCKPSPGGRIRALVMNSRDVTHIFVIDSNNHVFGSFDGATTWISLTANLKGLTRSVRTIELVNLNNAPDDITLAVGGEGGVWKMDRPQNSKAVWEPLASGLPRALVYDVHYDYTYDLFTAGTLGRGVWALKNFIRPGAGKEFQFVLHAKPAEKVPGIPVRPCQLAPRF